MSRHRSSITHDYASGRRARAAERAAEHAARARREQAVTDALRRARAPRADTDEAARFVFARAPRLTEPDYVLAVKRLLALAHVRPLADWSPRGKGRDALFRSLADHLLAKYPVPPMLWSVFFDTVTARFVPIVVRVAAGGSLYDAVRGATFPIPLTRRMCHDVLADRTSRTLLHAIRRAQVLAAGGDARLLAVWLRTPQAQAITGRDDETFWTTVLAWLVKNPPDTTQLGPLMDYVAHRRRHEPWFAMAGRSMAAMVRGMLDWHRELAVAKVVHGAAFAPSGFRAGTFNLSDRGPDGADRTKVWRVEEILTGKELADEGRRMGHCVYSYAWAVESRRTSIWSMTFEDGNGPTGRWSMLTIEVQNETRRVVQARGRFNRAPTSAEHTILLRWAGANGLTVMVGP